MTPQQLDPEAIMERLRQLLADLAVPGWEVGIRIICRSDYGGRVTFEIGGENDSNADH